LPNDSTIEVHDARGKRLACQIFINGVETRLVGRSDVFFMSVNSDSPTAALELKAPTKLKHANWFPVQSQVIAQLLMIQSMEKDNITTEGPLSMFTKAGVFDGFGMEIFCLFEATSEGPPPSCFMSQRVAGAADCVNLLLFLLADIGADRLADVAEARDGIVITQSADEEEEEEEDEETGPEKQMQDAVGNQLIISAAAPSSSQRSSPRFSTKSANKGKLTSMSYYNE
jgi:hypothetical protein